jgi:serine/threonine protein phosphatase PrpC
MTGPQPKRPDAVARAGDAEPTAAAPGASRTLRAPAPPPAKVHDETVDHETVDDEVDEDRNTLVPERRGNGTEPGIFVSIAGRTDVGLVREHNEDNFVVADLSTGTREPTAQRRLTPSGLLFGVCDGMGGAAAGEVASQMAVDTVLEVLRASVPTPDRDNLARALVRAIEDAGARIFESARADRSRRGMGTTATIAALMDRTLFVGQVGDSRAYILRRQELKQITKDQSLVNQLIEAGQLTEDEAEAFEHSNIILQALGTTAQVSVDLTFLELRRGDRLLMCSDGLSGLLHSDVIREVMLDYEGLDACGERLIELAKQAGGHDNITTILVDFDGAELALPQPEDVFGYQQYPLPPDDDGVYEAAPSEQLATAAPPALRQSTTRGLSERPRRSMAAPRRSQARTWLILLALGIVAGVLVGLLSRQISIPLPIAGTEAADALPSVRTVEERPSAPISVVVLTDVAGGERVVVGELHGMATDGRWAMQLTPGFHTFEARFAGKVVVSKTANVSPGETTVMLGRPPVDEVPVMDGPEDAEDPGADVPAASGDDKKSAKRRGRASRNVVNP